MQLTIAGQANDAVEAILAAWGYPCFQEGYGMILGWVGSHSSTVYAFRPDDLNVVEPKFTREEFIDVFQD